MGTRCVTARWAEPRDGVAYADPEAGLRHDQPGCRPDAALLGLHELDEVSAAALTDAPGSMRPPPSPPLAPPLGERYPSEPRHEVDELS